MKTRPVKHQELNTFKFIPFSERINSLRVNVFRHVKHKYEEDEDDEVTHFHKTYQKWIPMNSSQEFQQFQFDVRHSTQTLPQVIQLKDHLIDVLTKHLDSKPALSLQPILELVAALAQDLLKEFYPYFPKVYSHLMPLLETRDPEIIEWTFQCLAHLFKYLWRYLVANLNEFFDSLLPLLSSSKPKYLNNYAAQSFAFVARKVKDKQKLVKLFLSSINKQTDAVNGCGQLLFEIVRGVPGQFHSCAELTLNTFYGSLETISSQRQHYLFCQLLHSFVSHALNGIQPNQMCLLTNILLEKSAHLQSLREKDEMHLKTVRHLLAMIVSLVEYRNGYFVTEPEVLINALLVYAEPQNQSEVTITTVSTALTKLLLLPSLAIKQDTCSRIVSTAMAHFKGTTLHQFILDILPYRSFQVTVLPKVLRLSSTEDPMSMLTLLTQIVLNNSPLAKTSQELITWTPCVLNMSSVMQDKPEVYFDAYLDYLNRPYEDLLCDLDIVTNLIIVLPHFRPLNRSRAALTFKSLIDSSCAALKEISPESTLILSLALESLVNLKQDECVTQLCSPDVVVPALLRHCKSDLTALRALDFYICVDELNLVRSYSDEISSVMSDILLSPYHKFRLFATHILYEIEKSRADPHSPIIEVFERCWEAESIPATIFEYREKLKHLQWLDLNTKAINDAILMNSVDPSYPLRYLLGALYLNFKLVWDPISKHVLSYAKGIEKKQFWTVFSGALANVSRILRENEEDAHRTVSFKADHLSKMYSDLYNLNEKPDHLLYRLHLLEILKEFVPTYETHYREVVTEFFTFYDNEYLSRVSEAALTWDIRKESEAKDTTLDVTVENESGDENEDEDENDQNKSTEEDQVEDQKHKWVNRSLVSYLTVMAQVRSPKSIYREPDLHQIYVNFLTSKSMNIQKAALDCILNYKDNAITPYKEQLYGLINEKTFEQQVTMFRIDTQSAVLKPEHRPNLIPFVLRIAFTKLHGRVAVPKRRSRIKTKQNRKDSVIRFLAGCSNDELKSFFEMTFAIFEKSLATVNPDQMVTEVINSVDLSCVIPPKRLLSAAYTLNTMFVYCGGLLTPENTTHLLRVLLILGAQVVGIVNRQNSAHASYVTAARNVKKICFETLILFYNNFEHYQWTPEETDAVFKVFVWPHLPTLKNNANLSPTAVLRLLISWSQNPRYFVLFGKTHEEDSTLCPIRTLVETWASPIAHASVYSGILGVISSLLTLQMETEETQQPLVITNPAKMDSDFLNSLHVSEPLNYGSQLLVPYVPTILERLNRPLQTKMTEQERIVMSRVTELVTDAQSSEHLLSLLLPTLRGFIATTKIESVSALLQTVYNLIQNVEKPGRYVRKFAPLFGIYDDASVRKLLFSIVVTLSKLEGSESGLDGALLDELNAWDPKWVEQPDYEKRLAAFKKITAMVKNRTLTTNLGVIVIHTSFHFLKVATELSLRTNAKNCLLDVCPYLAQSVQGDKKERSYVIDETILSVIRYGIAPDQSESVRNDCISLLGHMAREVPELHPVLKDLAVYTNKDNLEDDFFENVTHLQVQRRTQALLKFSALAKTLEKAPAVPTLTRFMMPIASHYLLSEKFASASNTLVDAAIKAFGRICHFLPWHQYQTVLTNYLKLLQTKVEHQKQLVRILVKILKAFHFDLRLADTSTMSIVPKQVVEAVEEEKIDDVAEDDDKENENPDAMEVDQPIKPTQTGPIAKTKTLLSKNESTKVIEHILKRLLPRLLATLAKKTTAETYHKFNRKMLGPDKDEEDVLRVPLTVAVVKLLQILPTKEILDVYLPGIIMKLCTFLKSRMDSVRRVTRRTLQTILVSLGPSYLHVFVQEMTTTLVKGFHVHVLAYSIHAALGAIKKLFKKGDLDKSVDTIIEVCQMDLFGRAAEEKEVEQITRRVFEARANRSFDIFHILAQFISESHLLPLLLPLKNELSRTLSHKFLTRARTCLDQIVLGLTENNFLRIESLVEFAYGTASESIPALLVDIKKKREATEKELRLKEYEARRGPDCFIIPEDPRKKDPLEGTTCAQTNAHILVEFGLRLLYILLKREKLKDDVYKPLLDPIVKLLSDCLTSQHSKVSTLALQCTQWVVKMNLPSVRSHIEEITQTLFGLLHKYASAGLSKGDNFDLVMAAFKTVAVVVRDVKYHALTPEQFRILILYCEQDLGDNSRQATAFTLLKAILGRKVHTPELVSVMKKVGQLSVSAHLDSVRLQARQVMFNFLMNFGRKDDIETFLAFYFKQLNYNKQEGRESVLEMLKFITNSFPENAIHEHAGVIFVNVATSLVNDPQPLCRKAAAEIIGLLLSRVETNSRDKLFDVVQVWLQDSNVVHRRLGAQLVGIFVSSETDKFERRLESLLPLFSAQFTSGFEENRPGRFVRIQPPDEVQTEMSLEDRLRDHHLYQVLSALVKICTLCPVVLKKTEYSGSLEVITDHVQGLLSHSHEWVRHASVQLLGLIVTSSGPADLAKAANGEAPSAERPLSFLYIEPRIRLKSLALDLVSQLFPDDANEKFLMQCMKLLVFLAEVLKDLEPVEDDPLSLIWLVKRVRKMINNEIVNSPSSTVVRTVSFNWMAALSLKLSEPELQSIAGQLLAPLARELSLNDERTETLRRIALEATGYIKKSIGASQYDSIMAAISNRQAAKRTARRKERVKLVVTHPEKAAQRKINRLQKKKVARKRKIYEFKHEIFNRPKKKKRDADLADF